MALTITQALVRVQEFVAAKDQRPEGDTDWYELSVATDRSGEDEEFSAHIQAVTFLGKEERFEVVILYSGRGCCTMEQAIIELAESLP